jgi:hypothetical protein
MRTVESGSAPMEMIASAPAQMGLREIGDWAAHMERIGFDHISEIIHDPFTIAAMAFIPMLSLSTRPLSKQTSGYKPAKCILMMQRRCLIAIDRYAFRYSNSGLERRTAR